MRRSKAGESTTNPELRTNSWLVVALHALMYAVTAAVLVAPLANLAAVVAAAIGGSMGALLAHAALRRGVSPAPCIAGALVALWVSTVLRQGLLTTTWLAHRWGPEHAASVVDFCWFGLAAIAVVATLRLLTAIRRAFATLEAMLVAIAFAQALVQHRQGAIHRPYEIVDTLLAAGVDPTLFFLAAGACAAVIIALVLLREAQWWRTLLHLATIALLIVLTWAALLTAGVPAAPASTAGGLGLHGKSAAGKSANPSGKQHSGGSPKEELEFRDNYNEESKRFPVAVVLLHDDYSPPTGVYYFRQTVFSQFNGQRLVSATRSDVDDDIATSFPAVATSLEHAPRSGKWRLEVTTTVALMADHARPFALESLAKLQPAALPATGHFRRVYIAESNALRADYRELIGLGAGSPAWGVEQRRHYTQLPDDRRYPDLAQRIVRETLPERLRQDPVAQALALSAWLGHHGTYSLRSRHAQSPEPTGDFLFGDKVGYCVHFAHAMTYLLRSLGVPARVATGYAIEESARQGGSALLLSGQDSHAWAELYLQSVGWVAVDVVPETVVDSPPTPPDPELQRLLGKMVRGEPLNTPPMQQRVAALRGETMRWLRRAQRLLLALLLATWALLMMVKAWRRVAPRWVASTALPRVVYRLQLDRLGEVQQRRLAGESREAFASRLRATVPALQPITQWHLSAAFGGHQSPGPAELQLLSRQARRQMQQAFPWWKRIIGIIIPWSWCRSR